VPEYSVSSSESQLTFGKRRFKKDIPPPSKGSAEEEEEEESSLKLSRLDSGFASGFDLPRSRVKKFIVNIREIDYRFSLNSAAVSTSTMAASYSNFFFNVRDSNPERSNDVNAADQAGCGAINSNLKKSNLKKRKKKFQSQGFEPRRYPS